MNIPPDSKYICAGDWNLIFDATMDSFGKKAKLKRKAIYKNLLQMSRIYYFLISDDLQYAMKSCEFLCPLSRDHSPVKLTLHSQSIKKR